MLLILVSLCGLITCVSQHKHLLVHISCHSITKTKQGSWQRRRELHGAARARMPWQRRPQWALSSSQGARRGVAPPPAVRRGGQHVARRGPAPSAGRARPRVMALPRAPRARRRRISLRSGSSSLDHEQGTSAGRMRGPARVILLHRPHRAGCAVWEEER